MVSLIVVPTHTLIKLVKHQNQCDGSIVGVIQIHVQLEMSDLAWMWLADLDHGVGVTVFVLPFQCNVIRDGVHAISEQRELILLGPLITEHLE